MLERDLQDFLFNNPEILFPDQVIDRKRREVFIDGRRIDLLFEVGGVHYIIELKRDTIRREDIGQVFEYYGLMRQSNETANFKMILVAPSIPAYRRIPLEEFGIRCVEVPHRSDSTQDRAKIVSAAIGYTSFSIGTFGTMSRMLVVDLTNIPELPSIFEGGRVSTSNFCAVSRTMFLNRSIPIPRYTSSTRQRKLFRNTCDIDCEVPMAGGSTASFTRERRSPQGST